MVNETAVGQIIGREVEKLLFETDVSELGDAGIRFRPASNQSFDGFCRS